MSLMAPSILTVRTTVPDPDLDEARRDPDELSDSLIPATHEPGGTEQTSDVD